MLKNTISIIFIYIFMVGCEVYDIYASDFDEVEVETECSYCLLELSTDLALDDNNYYHLNFNQNYSINYTGIYAQVGNDYENVGWTSDTEYCFEWNYTTQCYNVVNGTSYSDSDGIATTILGVHQEHVGDTIKVYCGYTNNCSINYIDSLEVIINE